jgi:hypothetical protein
MIRTLARTVFVVVMIALCPALPAALANQEHPDTAKHEMKTSGRETGRAGKSLGHNVKHGRIIHGGKRFGQHIGRAGKHFGKGTKKEVDKGVKP